MCTPQGYVGHCLKSSLSFHSQIMLLKYLKQHIISLFDNTMQKKFIFLTIVYTVHVLLASTVNCAKAVNLIFYYFLLELWYNYDTLARTCTSSLCIVIKLLCFISLCLMLLAFIRNSLGDQNTLSGIYVTLWIALITWKYEHRESHSSK